MTTNIIVAVLIILGIYGLAEAWPLIAGPSIHIDSPADNSSFIGGIVEIKGKAVRAASLKLDGAPLLHDKDGVFSSTFTFPRGGSILTFTATDRFGKTVTTTRSIFIQ